MQFDELDSGAFHIYGGALDLPNGRYTAAVSVVTLLERDGRRRTETVFHEDRLAGGHAFESAEAALRFAIQTGREAVRRLSERPRTAPEARYGAGALA